MPAFCSLHILREPQTLAEIEDDAWAVRMAQAMGMPLIRSLLERIPRRYDWLL